MLSCNFYTNIYCGYNIVKEIKKEFSIRTDNFSEKG